MEENLRVTAHLVDYARCIDILARDGSSIGKRVEFEKMSEGIIPTPTLSISITAGQELMDSLWQCGLRPTEGKGSAGQLSAVEHHLSDMRKIASKKLGVQL